MNPNDPAKIFGTIAPPGPDIVKDPGTGFSRLITFGIQAFIFIGGIALLFYLMYGAFLWITSGGDSEKLETARGVMTQAVIGIIMMFVALAIFVVVAGDVLNIITRDSSGAIIFTLPTIDGNAGSGGGGGACLPSGSPSANGASCCSGGVTPNASGQLVCR
jgi:hypothetical protein